METLKSMASHVNATSVAPWSLTLLPYILQMSLMLVM